MSIPAKLERFIGYAFSDQRLLTQALTHRSFSDVNNERLEFLGDSILNFVIASKLYEQFPDVAEGDLSRLRAKMVRQETLAEIAKEIELGTFLTMGSGEMKSGGADRSSILSDALEAVFGAVLIDSDTETATTCIARLFEKRLQNLSESDLQKDAKSRLQEFLQGLGESVPEYVVLRATGKSPNQEFEVECRTSQLKAPVTAKGGSIRKAEQLAAELTLQALGA